MSVIAGEPASPVRGRRPAQTPVAALFWRLFGLNALIFLAAAAVLLISPATVSPHVSFAEIVVVAFGSALMLGINAVLLRTTLRPLDGLTSLMERVDLLRPGARMSVQGDRDVAHLIRTFNEMLDRLEHERGASSAYALAAQESERQRIARELHDEIGQSLTAVLLGLKRTIDRVPTDLRGELQVVQEMIRDCLDEVRMVARRLRPGVLEDLGLLSAMHALAADFSAVSTIPVTPRLEPTLPTLNKETELVLYRITQECLTNITRHAAATRVELELTRAPGNVTLHIADNGRGMNGAAEGAGIRGMRERAILIDADLTLSPGRTGGTELRLVVPTAMKD